MNMRVAYINFIRLMVEKKKDIEPPLSIDTNLKITKIEKIGQVNKGEEKKEKLYGEDTKGGKGFKGDKGDKSKEIENLREDEDLMKKESVKKGGGIELSFRFSLDYKPNQAILEILGRVGIIGDALDIEKIYNNWEKNKKIDMELTRQTLNTILLKANIKALQLCSEVGLPPHVYLPLIEKVKVKSNYIG